VKIYSGSDSEFRVPSEPLLKPLITLADDLGSIEGNRGPNGRPLRVQCCMMDLLPIPAELFKLRARHTLDGPVKIPDEQGKGFNPVKIIMIPETGNIIGPVKIQQDQSPAFAVGRIGFVLYKSAIQEAQGMAARGSGDPGPAGISIPGKVYLSAVNIIFLRWQGRPAAISDP